MRSGTEEWVGYAERDYNAAHILSVSHNPPFEIVAYHCQQSAEKYLKALLVEYTQQMPFIHDLGKLNIECCKFLPELSDIQNICERLTPFGTATRYPGGGMIVGPEHMPLVLSWAGKIRDIIRRLMNLRMEVGLDGFEPPTP